VRRLGIIAVLLLAGLTLTIGPAAAKDDAQSLRARAAQFATKVAALKAGVDDLDANFAKEIDERDRLMLRRRFVEGREFFYELHDYRGAVEVFYGIVNHPLAATLPNATEAVFYLAESLFHEHDYREAKKYFDQVVAGGRTDYYPLSLMRLIEIAAVRKDYAEAERLYAVILSEFKEGEDGSLGRYIIGKSYAVRGETAKAIEIFDSIPETGSYYATAQYYAAILFVKQNNYREAVNRLRQLRKALKGDVANKKEIFALTNMSLARIYYELNDFPQAMANYSAVPEGSDDYADALYEAMWVFVTRNDYLLKAIDDERGNYESVRGEYAEFRDAVDAQQDQDSLKTVVEQSDQMEEDLDKMKSMFDDIDKSLVRLQQDAVNGFKKLIQAAPNSPLLPDAELLAGNIYSQAEDFQSAEQWFVQLKKKYEDFHARVVAARPNFDSADYVNVVHAAATAGPQGAPLATSALKGLPSEVAYWLAADAQVRRIFVMYEAVSKERASVSEMRDMASDIQRRLNSLERGSEYPFLREAHRRDLHYSADIQTLQSELAGLRNEAGQANSNDPGAADINANAASYEATLQSLAPRLTALDGKIDAKKRERLAYFRTELATLRAPIPDFDRAIDGLMAQAGNQLATVAAQELAGIEQQVLEYAQRADLGIIDVAWRATRGSSRDIKKQQQQMEKELREFQRLHKPAAGEAPAAAPGVAPPPANPPGQTPPPSAPAPAGEPTPPQPPPPSSGQ